MLTEVESIYLEDSDTVVTARERLSGLRGRRVLLVWSPNGKSLRRKLDLVLLQREAHRRAIQLAIVSQDADLAHYASGLNISCFPSVEASQRERWKRGRQRVFLPRYHKPSDALAAEDFELIRARRRGHSPLRGLLERLIVLILLVAVVGAALYTIVPGATVTIQLQDESISTVIDVVADRKATAANLSKGVIPAQTIRTAVETTATIPTSGSTLLDSVSAAAIVSFSNLGQSLVVIPRGTVLGTSAGEPILFETVADVVIPPGAGQRVDAAVEAMDSYRGSVGNVGPGMINAVLGALAERVTVINLAPAAGGSNRSVKTVASADQDSLLAIARIQLQSLAFEQMRAKLSESQVIIIESIKIEEERKEWTVFSAGVGAMTSELTLTMRAVVSAQAIDDRFGKQLVLARLKAAVPTDAELLTETLVYARGPFAQGRVDGQISFTASGEATIMNKLDLSQLREQLTGISLVQARQLLEDLPEVSTDAPAMIDIFPASLQRMPVLSVRIDVQVMERR